MKYSINAIYFLVISISFLMVGCANNDSNRVIVLNEYSGVGIEYSPYQKTIKRQTIKDVDEDSTSTYIIESDNKGRIIHYNLETGSALFNIKGGYNYDDMTFSIYMPLFLINVTSGKIYTDDNGIVNRIAGNNSNGTEYYIEGDFDGNKVKSSSGNMGLFSVEHIMSWDNDLVNKTTVYVTDKEHSLLMTTIATYFYDSEQRINKIEEKFFMAGVNIEKTTFIENYNIYGDWIAAKAIYNTNGVITNLTITRDIEYFD